MANPNALYLLADHVKLSLLERQRSKALSLLRDDGDATNTDAGDGASDGAQAAADAQDGQIARSLEQFRDGLDALKREQARLDGEGEEGKALDIADALPGLEKKLDDLTKQFGGAAQSAPEGPASASPPAAATAKPKPKAKAVRFQDTTKPLPPAPGAAAGANPDNVDLEAQRSRLFSRYTDDPSEEEETEDQYRDVDNVQLHQMHARVMADQDAHLDALGVSISRQRELSMQIGDELDSQAALLEESDRLVDRHQSRLDRARRQVGRVARAASAGGDCKQMLAIVVLIVILVLLIAILK